MMSGDAKTVQHTHTVALYVEPKDKINLKLLNALGTIVENTITSLVWKI